MPVRLTKDWVQVIRTASKRERPLRCTQAARSVRPIKRVIKVTVSENSCLTRAVCVPGGQGHGENVEGRANSQSPTNAFKCGSKNQAFIMSDTF